ncbi:hypothetical protein H0H93_009140 [Arthromyces matolae]|nr:hypothetical protein H0H93_009140 [Arthromyces matolae]
MAVVLKPSHYLDFSPTHELDDITPSSQPAMAPSLTLSCKLTVSNPNKFAVSFKVKTTDYKRYVSRPNSQRLEAGAQAVVTLTYLLPQGTTNDISTDPMSRKDKFLIESKMAPPPPVLPPPVPPKDRVTAKRTSVFDFKRLTQWSRPPETKTKPKVSVQVIEPRPNLSPLSELADGALEPEVHRQKLKVRFVSVSESGTRNENNDSSMTARESSIVVSDTPPMYSTIAGAGAGTGAGGSSIQEVAPQNTQNVELIFQLERAHRELEHLQAKINDLTEAVRQSQS